MNISYKRYTHGIVILLVLLLFSSCDDEIVSYGEVNDPPLKLELKLEKREYRLLQDVKADFTVTNISSQRIRYGYSSGCQYGFTIEKGSKLILDSRQFYGCTQGLTELILRPGQSKTFELPFADISQEQAKNLEQGVYTISAFLLNNYSKEVSTTFVLRYEDPFNN